MTLTCSIHSWSVFSGDDGTKGPPGLKGDPGAPGEPGGPGAVGQSFFYYYYFPQWYCCCCYFCCCLNLQNSSKCLNHDAALDLPHHWKLENKLMLRGGANTGLRVWSLIWVGCEAPCLTSQRAEFFRQHCVQSEGKMKGQDRDSGSWRMFLVDVPAENSW